MESENKTDLNSILQSARTQLEMYGMSSHEDIMEGHKEMLMTRTKDDETEDTSGPLFDQRDQGSVVTVGNMSNEFKDTTQASKEFERLCTTPEIENEGEIDEESSNKNFDSSTITLGDQQSFQNQIELTSQTTYTNIHELTGPIKEEITIVTGPLVESPPSPDFQSAPSEEFAQETSSDATLQPSNLNQTTPDETAIQTSPESQQAKTNQMDEITSKKLDLREQTNRETVINELYPRVGNEEIVCKGDVAGTEDGSPARLGTSVNEEVADNVRALKIEGGKINLSSDGSKEAVDKPPAQSDHDSNINDNVSVNQVQILSVFDSPLKPEYFNDENPDVVAQEFQVDNRQIDFTQHYQGRRSGNTNYDEVFENEGFVDSRDLLQPTKVIFVSEDQEEEKSNKPFETDDDNSCSMDENSVADNLDLHVSPSLTNVRNAIDVNNGGKKKGQEMNLDCDKAHMNDKDTPPSNLIEDSINQQDLNAVKLLKLSEVMKPTTSFENLPNSVERQEPLLTPQLTSQVPEEVVLQFSAPKIIGFKTKVLDKPNDHHAFNKETRIGENHDFNFSSMEEAKSQRSQPATPISKDKKPAETSPPLHAPISSRASTPDDPNQSPTLPTQEIPQIRNPPRPPPRIRHSQKKYKLNFIKKIFGFRNDSGS